MVFPKTTEEVSAVLKYCSERRLAVVPQGANTSLVGGSVSVFDEVIISTKELDDIIDIDHDGGRDRMWGGSENDQWGRGS